MCYVGWDIDAQSGEFCFGGLTGEGCAAGHESALKGRKKGVVRVFVCVCSEEWFVCVRERQRAERLRGGESICRGTNAGQHVNRLLLRAQSRERKREVGAFVQQR